MHEKIMKKSLITNALLVLMKLIGGIAFKSAALVADGIHSLSDLLSDILVIFGLRQSKKPPDQEHPIGHGKIEYVLSMFLGVSILFVAYELIGHLIKDFGNSVSVPNIWTLYVVIITIVLKLILSRYLLKKSREIDSQIIHASGTESMTDVISSTVVFVGVIASLIGSNRNIDWLLYGDTVAGIIIALLIIRIGVKILRDAIRSIIGKSVQSSILEKTQTAIENMEGVIRVDRLDMIVYGHYYHVLIDIRVPGDISVKAGHDIADRVKKKLKEEEKNTHVIVHVNPEGIK